MPEQNHNEDIDRKIDYARLFMHRDRPLPKPGCSWAFYIFLILLAIAVAVMYVIYKTN